MNERIRKLAEKLPEYMDAALVTSNVGRYYYTGFLSSTGILLITRDNARLLVDFRYIEAAKRKVVDTEVLLLKMKAIK
jgi:Xaa-Pro aminopeptidase